MPKTSGILEYMATGSQDATNFQDMRSIGYLWRDVGETIPSSGSSGLHGGSIKKTSMLMVIYLMKPPLRIVDWEVRIFLGKSFISILGSEFPGSSPLRSRIQISMRSLRDVQDV